MIIGIEVVPGKGKTCEALRNIIENNSFQLCPKCQNTLSLPSIEPARAGDHFIYHCSECSSSFALVPFTAYQLQEVQLSSRELK